MIIVKTIIDLEEELYELKDYLPINTTNNFFTAMFSNLLIVKESDFYNNAIICVEPDLKTQILGN